ncbi:hypothetical protein LTR08_008821 [Meristemomyces frigidus]|nr:hypothetical protein LTR08_008821 [Meristemomyces frigidus]
MAQGERPARHIRQPSRITTSAIATSSNDSKQRAVKPPSPRDAATILFIKRVLCSKPTESGPLTEDEISERPLEELLPPLTSSNEIDLQLYAIISVILSQFVQIWYRRITPDSDFVGEVVQIIAHCTRGLEERLRHVDLEVLLLDELPKLFCTHHDAVQIARDAGRARYTSSAESHVRSIYHALRPHNALSPPPVDEATSLVQDENEVDWSQLLVSGIMPLLLPPEDLSNPCLDVLVSEVFSEMIVHKAVLGKVSEPWLLWESVTKVVHIVRPRLLKESSFTPTSRLEQFGLLASADSTRHDDPGARTGTVNTATFAFWSSLQYALVVWTLLRAFVIAILHASSIQPRPKRVSRETEASDKTQIMADELADGPTKNAIAEERPIVSMRMWSCVERLTSLRHRMPWLTGSLSLLQWLSLHGPGQMCRTNGALDRLLSAQVHDRLLNPALLPPILHAIRVAVFPDNVLAPPRVQPTNAEVDEIKHECARRIVGAIPEPVRTYYFGTTEIEIMEKDVENKLDIFGDEYMNKHLIVAAVELIVVRLFPELATPMSTA